MAESSVKLTDQDRWHADYLRDGAVHIPGLLSADWVNQLRDVLCAAREEFVAIRSDAKSVNGTVTVATERYPTAEFSQARGRFTMRWLWRDVDTVRRFFTESGVAPVVAAVIGARRIQYWYDLTFFQDPDPEGEGSPWHHDIAAFPCKGEQIPSLWIAITDGDPDMSPLQCIRDSHRDRTMFRPPVYIDPSIELPPGYADLPDVDAAIARGEAEVLEWPVKAGDALIINPYTLHGAPPNRSGKSRISFTTRWAGDDVVWRPDAFSMKVPGIDLATVPVGQRPDGKFFPYAD